MNQAKYQEGLEEFLQYGETLIANNLLPYADQIKGEWEASTIKDCFVDSYARATFLFHPEFFNRYPRVKIPEINNGSLASVAEDLSSEISQEIFRFYSRHGTGVIFIIDFRPFKKDIEDKLRAIQTKEKL